MSQTATEFPMSSSLIRLPAMSGVTPLGGQSVWSCVCTT